MLEGYMTVQEAAKVLGVSGRHVRLLISSGDLPATRFGERAWAIQESDLNAFIETREKEAQARQGRVGRPIKLPESEEKSHDQ